MRYVGRGTRQEQRGGIVLSVPFLLASLLLEIGVCFDRSEHCPGSEDP